MPRQSRNQVEPLLIDRAATAELPSAEGVREWAREKRAFISNVMAELAAERQAAAAGVRAVGLRAVMFDPSGSAAVKITVVAACPAQSDQADDND
jgi:hypothetical protein